MEVNGQVLTGLPVPPEFVGLHGRAAADTPQALFFQKILVLYGMLVAAFPRAMPTVQYWSFSTVHLKVLFGDTHSGGFVAMNGINQRRRLRNLERLLHPDKIGMYWEHDPEQFGWVPYVCSVLAGAYAYMGCMHYGVPFTGIAPSAPLVALASSADILLRLAAAEARAKPRGGGALSGLRRCRAGGSGGYPGSSGGLSRRR